MNKIYVLNLKWLNANLIRYKYECYMKNVLSQFAYNCISVMFFVLISCTLFVSVFFIFCYFATYPSCIKLTQKFECGHLRHVKCVKFDMNFPMCVVNI